MKVATEQEDDRPEVARVAEAARFALGRLNQSVVRLGGSVGQTRASECQQLWSSFGGAAIVLAQVPGALRDGFQSGLGIMFLAGFPKLHEYYNQLPKEELIRKLMLGKMQRNDYAETRNNEIKAWVAENPEIQKRVEERIRNVPEANRQRAFINAAKQEAMNQTVRSNGVRP